MKGNVSDIVVAQQARRHHELREKGGRDAALASVLEVDPLVAEEVDRVGRVIVSRNVEIAEIELPDEAAVGLAEVGEVPKRVGERDPHLNELERVDIGFESPVPLQGVGVGAVVADNDAGELGVHGNEGIPIDELADEGEFFLEIPVPDWPDYDCLFRVVELHFGRPC